MRTTLFIALLCLASAPAGAQGTLPPLTVGEAVALAVKQNPRLSAAARDIVAARHGVSSARALTNPDVAFTPALSSIGGSDEEFRVQQPLELNGTRSARTGAAVAQLAQTRAGAIVELRNLVGQTKSTYYELARTRDLRELSADVLKTAEEFDRITRRQVEVGTRPGIDQVQTGIEVAQARHHLTLADSQVTAAVAALNTLMGRMPGQPIGPLPTLTASADTGVHPEAVPADRDAALRQALSARAEITFEEALREQFRQEARLARAQGRPDLAPQFRAGSVTRGFSDSGVGIGITLPFLDYGSRRHRVRQAETLARAQQDRIAAAQNEVRREVEQAIVRLTAAEAIIRDYQAGVLDQARRLLEATRTGFRTGLYSVIQVLEAQRAYRAVQTDYINALVAHAQARAELERALGAVPEDLLPRPDATGAVQGPPR